MTVLTPAHAYYTSLLGLPQVHHNVFLNYVQQLESASGRAGLLEGLMETKQQRVVDALRYLGCDPTLSPDALGDCLQQQFTLVTEEVARVLGSPTLDSVAGWQAVAEQVKQRVPLETRQGYFLTHERARELLRACPPQEIVDYFGYSSVEELLEKEDVRELFAALRFGVSDDYSSQLLQQYALLTPQDFEERESEFIILDPHKWFELARTFAEKKLHPNSHLKELGVLFAIPNPEAATTDRDLTMVVSLAFHYYYEIHFYAQYILRLVAESHPRFGEAIQQMILGAVLAQELPTDGIRITHQYYTKKEHPNEMAFQPHVMPEPLHWRHGRALLQQLVCEGYQQPLDCILTVWEQWHRLGLPMEAEVRSFNFEDILVSKKEFRQYHLYEVLWNELFESAFPHRSLHDELVRHLDTGIIPLTS